MKLYNNITTFSGIYIREFGINLWDKNYDINTGIYKTYVDGFFSNSGKVTFDIKNEFEAWVTLMQFDDKQMVQIYRTVTGNMDVGEKKLEIIADK